MSTICAALGSYHLNTALVFMRVESYVHDAQRVEVRRQVLIAHGCAEAARPVVVVVRLLLPLLLRVL